MMSCYSIIEEEWTLQIMTLHTYKDMFLHVFFE